MRRAISFVCILAALCCLATLAFAGGVTPLHESITRFDGSDPMPLCRDRLPLNCPKVAVPQPSSMSFDGGPGPICPPKQQCPWTAERQAEQQNQMRPMYRLADGGPIPLCSPKCQWSPEHCTFYCPAARKHHLA